MRLKDGYYITQRYKNLSMTESEFKLIECDNWGLSKAEHVIITGSIEKIENYCRKYDLLLETSKSI